MIRDRIDRWFDQFRRTGDPRKLARVFDVAAPELWRVAVHLSRDRHAIEDAVQATFLTAIEARHEWDAGRPLLPWLLGHLANRVREQRRQTARAPDATRLERAGERDPAAVAADREVSAALATALARLDEPYRSTLERHLVHGLAAHEVAAELGVPAGTVRMRLHRGLDRLRRQLPPGLVATGIAAFPPEPAAMAAMKAKVLGAVPGGVVVAAGSGHVGSLVIGVMLMSKSFWFVLVSGAALLSTWRIWSQPASAPAAAESTRVAAAGASAVGPAVEPAAPAGAAAAAPLRERVAVPAPAAAREPAEGLLRVRVRVAGAGTALDGAWLAVHAGEEREAGPSTAPSPRAARDGDDPSVGGGRTRTMRSRTDGEGLAQFSAPVGYATVSSEEYGFSERIEIRSAAVTELELEAPVRFAAELRVVDDAGRPVADARIVGSASRDVFGCASREYARTDGAGGCVMPSVDRELRVRAHRDGFAASPSVELDERRTDAVLRLGAAPAAVAGTVAAADGRALSGCVVAVQPLPRRPGDAAPLVVWTDAAGRFRCPDVPAGKALVVAARRLDDGSSRLTGAEVDLTAGAEAFLSLTFGGGATLAVRLAHADGTPVRGANLTATPADERLGGFGRSVGSVLIETDAGGAGSVGDLMPGRYRLSVPSLGLFAHDIELEAGVTARFEHVVGAGPRLDVRVVDAEGRPLAGWRVTWVGGDVGRRATTDGGGRAHFTDLPPGPGRVAVQRDDATLPCAEREVAQDSSVTIAIDPARRGDATLRGVLVSPAGTATADLRAMLVQRGADPTAPVRPLTLAIDAATGAFAAEELVPGVYTLVVEDRRGHRPLLLRDGIAVSAHGAVDLGRIALGTGTLAVRATTADGNVVDGLWVGIRLRGEGPFAPWPGGSEADPASPAGCELALPEGDYEVALWGESTVAVASTARVDVDITTRLQLVAAAGARVAIRIAASGEDAELGVLTVRAPGAGPLRVVVQRSDPLVRGFAPGRHELEFVDLRGNRFAATVTVEGDRRPQEVVLRRVP